MKMARGGVLEEARRRGKKRIRLPLAVLLVFSEKSAVI